MQAVTPLAPPVTTKRPRDVRLDFFRGAALLIILYDHVLWGAETTLPFYLQATPIFWGLACAAIIFVFISGQVYGLVYGKIFDRDGLGPTVKKSLVRAWQLYLANFFTFAAVWLTVRILQDYGFAEGIMSDELVQMHERWNGWISPILAFARFANMPDLFDVLPLYMILVAIGPVIIAGLNRWPRATLLASAAIYVGAQFGLKLPMTVLGLQPFYFNPCAWQLVFTVGIAIARFKPKIPRSVPVVIAGVVLILAVAVRIWVIPYAVHRGYLAPSPAWEVDPSWGDRANLHYVRIFYFAVLAYVVICFLPKSDWFWNSSPVRGIRLLGRHTLLGFCIGVWFSWVSDPILIHLHGKWSDALAAFVLGGALTLAVALAAEHRARALRSGPAPGTST